MVVVIEAAFLNRCSTSRCHLCTRYNFFRHAVHCSASLICNCIARWVSDSLAAVIVVAVAVRDAADNDDDHDNDDDDDADADIAADSDIVDESFPLLFIPSRNRYTYL